MAVSISQLPEEARALVKRSVQPGWVNPMLATLTDERFSREGWIFEPKFDGERCLAFKTGPEVHLYSRNRLSLNASYPELVAVFEHQKSKDFIVDGEVVAFKGQVTSFESLQGRMQSRGADSELMKEVPIFYYLFDILYLNGYDLRRLPLRYRKQLLKQSINFKDPLRLAPHIETEGLPYYQQACRKGWEGVIAKRFDAPYVSVRSKDWLKFKCVLEQELVVGGYTDPQRSRTGFGALLVGYYSRGKLIYAGKVGTGFNEDTLNSLGVELRKLEQEDSAFSDLSKGKGIHWVKPKLVAQVGFTEWTNYGKLRHPRFLGLRRDKAAKDVVREG
jgi:bifunctional non-homologous end joining protein LigD